MNSKSELKKYAPFSRKQQEYIRKTKNSWFNVAEGSKRGKSNG